MTRRHRVDASRVVLGRVVPAASSAVASSQTAVEAPATGSRVTINGMQLYYEVSGHGDPLIVLHGAYMNIPSMGAIIPKLAKTHKVYALELQGHGRTTDIDRPITYPNMADDVAAFMDAVVCRRRTYSATRWAPSWGCSSPSVTRPRSTSSPQRPSPTTSRAGSQSSKPSSRK